MNALIFGANGQDAHYLKKICVAKGIDVTAVSRQSSEVKADVACAKQVEELIRKLQPSYIFHLAANSTTRHDALLENQQTIAIGTLNILEAVKLFSPHSKVFITGSGVQFVNTGKPISETDTFEPNSAYSVARIQSVYAARYYRRLGIAAYVGYLFHHESPLRKEHHVSQLIVSFVKDIAAGHDKRISLGDIDVQKEWCFAGDIAEGMMTLVEQDNVFETVIGSGIPYSIKDWLELSFQSIGRNWQNFVDLRSGFTPEYKMLVSNPKTMFELGWQPKVNFKELNNMMMSN